MKRITDPNEIEELRKGGLVLTGKSLLAGLASALLLGVLIGVVGNGSGLPRWSMYGGLAIVVYVTVYIVASKAGKNK